MRKGIFQRKYINSQQALKDANAINHEEHNQTHSELSCSCSDVYYPHKQRNNKCFSKFVEKRESLLHQQNWNFNSLLGN